MSSLKVSLLVLLLACWLGCHEIEARYVSKIPKICYQPPPHSEVICTVEIEGFYYDPATLDCQMYSVGACRVTPGQTFGRLEDCVATCIGRSRSPSPDYYRNE